MHLRRLHWGRQGIWRCVFEVLGQDADNEYVLIDSTIVKSYWHSAGTKKRGLS